MSIGSSSAVDLDLRNYLQVARRRWVVIVLLALLIPAISVLVAVRRQPRYEASSEVLVKRQNLAASLTPGQVPYTDAQTAERVVETQVQLARVPDLADRVIAAAGLTGRVTAADLLGSSTVTAKPKSDILVFRVEWLSPTLARSLAGSYADEFSTYRRQLDTTELGSLETSVRSQVAAIDTPDGRKTPLYEDLQDKLKQIQTLQALQTSSAVVVRRPDAADKVGPTPVTMGLGGLLLGLLLGGALAFLLESLDTRVRRSSDVAAILDLPLLARLPKPPGRIRKRSGMVVMEEPESQAAEAFAFLRTNLAFANMASEAKVIMFCSAVQQEGKSTTISNLAVALARAGSRVVLVDLDYRRPTVHSFFSIPRSPGVTEVSRGTVGLDQAVREVVVPATEPGSVAAQNNGNERFIRVLPAGGVTHRIDVEEVMSVLDRLRDGADVVLVDAPPMLLVGEALALSARMEALIVVTRLNHVRRPMLEELRRAFDGAPVRPLGFVATAAAEEPGYSHYYGKAYTYTRDEGPPLVPTAPAPRLPSPTPAAVPTVTGSNMVGPAPRPPDGETKQVPDRQAADAAPPEPVPLPASRAALAEAVFANGRRTEDGSPGLDMPPTPPTGVRPRRSWTRDVPSASSQVAVDQGALGVPDTPSAPNGAPKEGEGTER
jgi:Mrp family chromosome partitioning ATPase/capsular polysaccharide biosynthesis protein